MRQRTLIIVTLLEVYALILANIQSLSGVKTDEAKYLLNIPYPHPPFARWLFHLMEWLPFQEMFVRAILASLLIQAMWLIWDMARKLHLEDRLVLCGSWLVCSAVILQAGTIMISPIVALGGIVLLWLQSRRDLAERMPGIIGLFWLMLLFTSYQSVLYVPIALSVFRRGKHATVPALLYTFVPILLLALYTPGNLHALATMVLHETEAAHQSVAERLWGMLKLAMVGGSLLVGIFGTWGMILARRWSLILSLGLVCLYLFLSLPFPFYAILFAPLFIGGLKDFFVYRKHPHFKHHGPARSFPFIACIAAASIIIVILLRPPFHPGPARATMQLLREQNISGEVMIAGSFGHEWQYESRWPVRRYRPDQLERVGAIICFDRCTPIPGERGWKMLPEMGEVEVWVKKSQIPSTKSQEK